MKTYKIATLWLIASAIRGLAPVFLTLFTLYIVYIEESLEFTAGYFIGTVASIIFLWFGIKQSIIFFENFRRNTQIDENRIIIDDEELRWQDIDHIIFQGAEGFDAAIIVTKKQSGEEHYIPAYTGMFALIELGNEIEKHAFKHDIKISKPDVEIEQVDPENIAKPAGENAGDAVNQILARTYNKWLSADLDHLDDTLKMQALRISFAGFLTMYENDMDDLTELNQTRSFGADEFLLGAVTNSYIMTNKIIFFHSDKSLIDLNDISTHSSEGGGWSFTLTLTLKNGDEKRYEKLDAVPTDEYFEYGMT